LRAVQRGQRGGEREREASLLFTPRPIAATTPRPRVISYRERERREKSERRVLRERRETERVRRGAI